MDKLLVSIVLCNLALMIRLIRLTVEHEGTFDAFGQIRCEVFITWDVDVLEAVSKVLLHVRLGERSYDACRTKSLVDHLLTP